MAPGANSDSLSVVFAVVLRVEIVGGGVGVRVGVRQ